MEPWSAVLIAAAIVAVSAIVGWVWSDRQGRTRRVPDGVFFAPADLPGVSGFGERATLVQFSTVFCAQCPATRRLLDTIAAERHGVVRVEVDLTDERQLATRLHILQTPTTFVLDADGRLVTRIGGPPRREVVAAVLDDLTAERVTA